MMEVCRRLSSPGLPSSSCPVSRISVGLTALLLAVERPSRRPQETVTTADDLPRDLSPWGMYLSADWVVKSVMIGLLIASVVTWTVWLAKTIELLVRQAQRAEAP